MTDLPTSVTIGDVAIHWEDGRVMLDAPAMPVALNPKHARVVGAYLQVAASGAEGVDDEKLEALIRAVGQRTGTQPFRREGD